MTRLARIEVRAALLAEPARSRVRKVVDGVKRGRFDASAVADLSRAWSGGRWFALELAAEVVEWRLAGSVAIEGSASWGGWNVRVWPEDARAWLALEDPGRGGYVLRFEPESEDARHSSAMSEAVCLYARELEAHLGRVVRVVER